MRAWRVAVWAWCAAFAGGAGARGQCPGHWLEGGGIPGVQYGPVSATGLWDPDGTGPAPERLVVGGAFQVAGATQVSNVAAWDGVAWGPLGQGLNAGVYALARLPGGDLLAGGAFTTSGGITRQHLARWDGTAWRDFGGGVNGNVYAILVSAEGDVLVAGSFSQAGGVPAASVARWNSGTATWSALGSGIGGGVFALAQLPGGEVVAGGNFASAGGVPANEIAMWDGTSWRAMGSGMQGPYDPYVRALLVTPDGTLVVGGNFVRAGGVVVRNVARYGEGGWSAMGAIFSEEQYTSSLRALALTPKGEVLAGGYFFTGDSQLAGSIARWDGAAWIGLGRGVSYSVESITVRDTDELFVGGSFSQAGDANADNVARWDGKRWSALGAPAFDRTVHAVEELSNGNLVAGGQFFGEGEEELRFIAQHDGERWRPMGTGMNGFVLDLAHVGDDLIAAGSFTTAGDVPVGGIARWDGEAWSELEDSDGAMPASVSVLLAPGDGTLLAGGRFTSESGVLNEHVARWDGARWTLLGSAMTGQVMSLAQMPNGDVVAGGYFGSAGGVPANRIARWNGTSWSALGPGLGINPGDAVLALAVLDDGDILAGGAFFRSGQTTVLGMARWHGGAWTRVNGSVGGNPAEVYAFEFLPGGDLMVGGRYTTAGGVVANNIARWTPTGTGSWSTLGSGLTENSYGVRSVKALGGTRVAVGGYFAMAGDRPAPSFAVYDFGVEPLGIAEHPRAMNACPVGESHMSVAARGGSGDLRYAWRRNGVALRDEAGHLVGTASDRLTITRAQARDAGSYDCVVSDACGSAVSDAASLRVCMTDLTCDGVNDSRDYFEFVHAFFNGSMDGDFNRDGAVNSGDYFQFVAAFMAGCGA